MADGGGVGLPGAAVVGAAGVWTASGIGSVWMGTIMTVPGRAAGAAAVVGGGGAAASPELFVLGSKAADLLGMIGLPKNIVFCTT